MNKLPLEKRIQIISLLVEGNSLRSTSRIVDCSINTVTKLLVDAGWACAQYQYEYLRNLKCKRIQVDEIWSFCYSKQKNVPEDKKDEFGYGDVWTWTAIDAKTKLIPSWLVGSRDSECAKQFIADLAARLSNRIQLTSDGYKLYLDAVEDAFHGNIDYAMLIKIYDELATEKRYSPGNFAGTKAKKIVGNPEKAHISTSYIERQNLTMRMCMRRFTRLTNAFSKKIDNHCHAIALHFMHYNFVRIHKSLRVTPAMAAGVTDHLWEIKDIIDLIDRA